MFQIFKITVTSAASLRRETHTSFRSELVEIHSPFEFFLLNLFCLHETHSSYM